MNILFLFALRLDFKSDPNKTTADNIHAFLEKKNINTIYEHTKPKFTTINTVPQIKPSISEIPVNINSNYAQEQEKRDSHAMVKDEDLSDVDSDLDVFVRKFGISNQFVIIILIYIFIGGTKSGSNEKRR